MNHGNLRKALGRYLEGELGPATRLEVEQHLNECSACATELQELRAAVALVRALPEVESPPGLTTAVMERLREAEIGSGRPRPAAWIRNLVRLPLAAPLAAGAMGLLVLAVFRWSDGAMEPLAGLPERAPSVARPVPAAPTERPPAAPVQDRPGPIARPPVRASEEATGEPRMSHFSAVEEEVEPAAPRHAPSMTVVPPGALRQTAAGEVPTSVPEFRFPSERAGREGWSPLPPLPDLDLCRQLTRGLLEAQIGCRPWLSGMLTLAQYDPTGFLRALEEIPESARDAWVVELTQFAAGSGGASAAARALRTLPDPRALSVARRFEGALASPSSERR